MISYGKLIINGVEAKLAIIHLDSIYPGFYEIAIRKKVQEILDAAVANGLDPEQMARAGSIFTITIGEDDLLDTDYMEDVASPDWEPPMDAYEVEAEYWEADAAMNAESARLKDEEESETFRGKYDTIDISEGMFTNEVKVIIESMKDEPVERGGEINPPHDPNNGDDGFPF